MQMEYISNVNTQYTQVLMEFNENNKQKRMDRKSIYYG